MVGEKEEEITVHRPSLKANVPFKNHSEWKDRLREKCFKRIREDRTRLLWKVRLSNNMDQSMHQQDIIKATFQDIVSDELKSINEYSEDDSIWEYDGLPSAYDGDCEEILLEMQRIFYEELRMEERQKEMRNWDDEEDEYLARELYKHMQLHDEEGQKEVWCPICKHGALQEHSHLICCTLCKLQLDRGDEVNLELLRSRLAEAHAEHLERGCKLSPGFCVESRFGLTALYIKCQGCATFEVVI